MSHTLLKSVVHRGLLVTFIMSVLWTISGAETHAQSFNERLTSMKKDYASVEKMHVVMNIRVLEKEGAAEPFYKETADLKKDGVKYHSRFGATEMLMNERYILMVDRDAKEIYLSRRNVNDEKRYMDAFQSTLDSLARFQQMPELISGSGGFEHYRLRLKTGDIRQVDMVINTGTNTLSKLEYRYEDGQFAVIDIATFDKAPRFGATDFEESRYVLTANNKLQASTAFKGYHIIAADEN